MRDGTLVPAVLTMSVGTVAATTTLDLGTGWLAIVATVLVAYGAVLFAQGLDP